MKSKCFGDAQFWAWLRICVWNARDCRHDVSETDDLAGTLNRYAGLSDATTDLVMDRGRSAVYVVEVSAMSITVLYFVSLSLK